MIRIISDSNQFKVIQILDFYIVIILVRPIFIIKTEDNTSNSFNRFSPQ